MKGKRKNLKERMFALILAVILTVTGILPQGVVEVQAAVGDPIDVIFTVTDGTDPISGATVKVDDKEVQTDDEGECTISGLTDGTEYTYTVTKQYYSSKTEQFTASSSPVSVALSKEVTSITLQCNTTKIEINDKCTIEATTAPTAGEMCTWHSSNPNVATVNDGVVTGKKAGKTTITASYGDVTSADGIEIEVTKIATELQLETEVNPSNKEDAVSITCTVSGAPANAELKYYVNDAADPFYTGTETSVTYYNNNDNLIKSITFTVAYDGDETYAGSKAEKTIDELYRNQKIVFEDAENSSTNPKIVTRPKAGDEALTLDIKIDNEKSKIKGKVSYSSDSDLIRVNSETGEVTVNATEENSRKSGLAAVTVTAAVPQEGDANDAYWKEATATYYIFVQEPINIEELEFDQVSAEKTYDGSGNLPEINALISADALDIYTGNIDTSKQIKFVFKGAMEQTNASTYSNATVTLTELVKIVGYDTENTEIDLTDQVDVAEWLEVILSNASVTIGKREVTLGTDDVTVEYAKDAKTVEEQFAMASEDYGTNGKVYVTNDNDTGELLAADNIEVSKFKAQVDPTAAECGYTVDETTKVKPSLGEINNTYTNYNFVADEENLGDLTVTKANISIEDLEKIITFNSEDTQLYTDDSQEGKIWIRGGKLTAKINKDSEYAKFFDEVVSEEENLTTEGYQAEEITYAVTKDICLKKNGRIQTNSKDFEIIVDLTAPEFKFGNWCTAKALDDKLAQIITFNAYQNTSINLEDLQASDNSKENNASGIDEVNQSGVKEWSYKIYKTTDTTDVTKEDLEGFAENLEYPWTKAESDTTSISVAVVEGSLEEILESGIEGNYIVLINIIDNVGNEVTLTSDGIILDYRSPKINITGNSGEKLSDTLYYKDDVDFEVTFEDETITSGFKSAKIEIVVDGETKESYEYDFLKLYSEEESIEETVLDNEGNKNGLNDEGGYTLSQINELAARKLTTTTGTEVGSELKVSKTYNSNNIVIRVTAYDQAMNKTIAEQNLMIDSKEPEIAVHYSSEDEEGNIVTAQNDKYYKASRTMEITYTEKNFDADRVTFSVLAGPNIDITDVDSIPVVSVNDLETYGIIIEKTDDGKIFKDSEPESEPESQWSLSTHTDKRTNTLTLKFDEDNEYYILPHCNDLASNPENTEIVYTGNDTEMAKTTFVIDKTSPEIAVSFAPIIPGKEESARVYTQEEVTAVVTIKEKNFYEGNVLKENQVDFGNTYGKDAEGEAVVKSSVYQDIALGQEKWFSNGGDEYTNSLFKFSEDANYTFGFTYTDLAGNTATYSPVYFTVDDTPPTGTISIDDNTWGSFLETITFGIFKNTPYDVSMTYSDVTSGVEPAMVQYYKTSSEKNMTELQAYGEWIKYAPFSVGPNQEFIVYAKIVDKAGNETYISTNGAIADNRGPQISFVNESSIKNKIHNGNVSVRINVNDPITGNTYSGLKYVWYKIESTGNEVNSTPSERTSRYTLVNNSSNAVKDEANRTYTGNIIVPARDFNSNDVTVTVYAEDFAGTVSHKNIKLSIDVTDPVIENIQWNTNNASNGKYYNVTRVATITVRERNFDSNQVRLNITNTDGTAAQVSSWRVDSSGTSDNNINTCTVTFAADGDYNMNISCTDKAGRNSNTVTAEEFTIDKTIPTINVSFDNNNVANGKYYNAVRTATITVNEHNFRGSDVQTAITSNTSTPGVNGWSGSSNVHTATVPFMTDGEYSFTVNYTDLAGNRAEVYNVDEFVIDLTKPTIEIFDIEDKSANNGEVAPGVRYSDTNYDVAGVSITYKGANHPEEAVDGTRTAIPNGESIKMADFAHTEGTDDVYTMVAHVTDLAGNSEEKQVTFSVNRFGSNFIFSDATEDFLDNYYNNEEEDLVVTEINVDTLTHRGITSGHDGSTTDLIEGTDYTVRESGSEVSWKSYQYTISKENFEKEGMYSITIDSVDRATNQVNNKIKEADIDFVIDKTAPTVVITGIEDGGQYRSDTRDITVSVADNVAMEKVDVYTNDGNKETSEPYDEALIRSQNGELSYTITSSSDWQEIKAVAVDKAGNVTDTSLTDGSDSERWMSVLVTSNLFVQFYRNTPLLIGTIVAVVVIGGGLFFLILAKKRRKDEEEQKAAQ